MTTQTRVRSSRHFTESQIRKAWIATECPDLDHCPRPRDHEPSPAFIRQLAHFLGALPTPASLDSEAQA